MNINSNLFCQSGTLKTSFIELWHDDGKLDLKLICFPSRSPRHAHNWFILSQWNPRHTALNYLDSCQLSSTIIQE